MQIVVRRRAKISIEDKAAVFLGDEKLVLVGIEDLDAVLRSLDEGRAMPRIFMRAVGGAEVARPTRAFRPWSVAAVIQG